MSTLIESTGMVSLHFTPNSNGAAGGTYYAQENNVLARTPDAGGLAFWQNKLSNEGWTTADVLGFFSTSSENVTNVTPLIANGIQYQQFVG